MSKRPYIINQAFVMSKDGSVNPPGQTVEIILDYSTYDGMVEDVGVFLLTNEAGQSVLETVIAELYEGVDDENPESASGFVKFADEHAIDWDEQLTFREIGERLELSIEYAKEVSPIIDLSVYGELAHKTWYAIDTRKIT